MPATSPIRRDQVHAMDPTSDHLESFQRHVADLLSPLSSSDDLLSLSFLHKLLHSFLLIHDHFHSLLLSSSPLPLSRPPLDRLLTDFFDRSVKALDLCNAIRDGLDHIRQWRNHLDIIAAALTSSSSSSSSVGEAQIRRAKKALTDLTILMLDEKDASSSAVSHRNRSFGRAAKGSPIHHHHHRRSSSSGGGTDSHFRSLSWSVSRSWSAARQLQAIGANISVPKSAEVVATGGMAIPIYTMNSVLLFVMWVLVAAIPCQDRGLQIHFSVPRSFIWAGPVMGLHDRILEESKKRERKNANGLLKEIYSIEKCSRSLIELTDNCQGPIGEEKEEEFRVGVKGLMEVCDALKEGLDPLERQVREVFHRIVKRRTEGLDFLSHNSE